MVYAMVVVTCMVMDGKHNCAAYMVPLRFVTETHCDQAKALAVKGNFETAHKLGWNVTFVDVRCQGLGGDKS